MMVMTLDEIAAMPAGRELDRLVALRIFGAQWRRYQNRHTMQPVRYLVTPKEDKEHAATEEPWLPSDGTEDVGSDPSRYPRTYSTSIAAAWAVVEKLRKTHAVTITAQGKLGHLWDCLLVRYEDGKTVALEGGQTAALVICRAALAATEAHS